MGKIIKLYRCELDYSIASKAWVIYDSHPELNEHIRHQIADVCEGENRWQVTRILNSRYYELLRKYRKYLANDMFSDQVEIDNHLESPEYYLFEFKEMPDSCGELEMLCGQLHGYMAWEVLKEWLAPWVASESKLAAAAASEYLSKAGVIIRGSKCCRRRLPPIA